MPLTRIIDARYVAGHRVWIEFNDGATGEVDLAAELIGPVFAPIKDVATFQRFRLHEELHTLVWPNGADFAPEFLRGKLRDAG
jgi:hypothetical protein